MKLPVHEGCLVVTSIAAPNPVLISLAQGASKRKMKFVVIGDSKSPKQFELEGAEYYGLEQQRALPFSYARLCHERSYTRKNIGYLVAMAAGARFILETDDDNFPLDDFWNDREETVEGSVISTSDWVNAYRYFSSTSIYPRGFPIERLNPNGTTKRPDRPATTSASCPIQQGLANRNPDVDAIYRMLFPLPVDFDDGAPIMLAAKTWCPFNSQNTVFFHQVFPLLYLPTHCSFRMTDIWRSFVAQRILWTCGWTLSFHAASVYQERNEHDLLVDFADEVPGYLNNAKIARALDSAELLPGVDSMPENLRICYRELIRIGVIDEKEMPLLEAWLADYQSIAREGR